MEKKVGYHEPVMLAECVEGLNIKEGGVYVDVTFGGGGHSRGILKAMKGGKLIAFDQDEDALQNVPVDDRFLLINKNFNELKSALNAAGVFEIDGLLADLGVSSHQFDEGERGFSIRFNTKLDMRMDRREGLTAEDILNEYDQKQLAYLFRAYGELKCANRLANLIVDNRKLKRIVTVEDLKEAVSACAPKFKEHTFYAQLFQAIRIEVNQELKVLEEMLLQAIAVLKPGGRLVVMSYHSLEDRIVKSIINKGSVEGELQKDFFGNVIGVPLKAINKKPIEASEEEVKSNTRSRSAKLRIAEKK
ncbi:MAG: 16S rRNA (cytosine(1402)-N(4))-methyltransferase RsmH [Bacteroidota bacterium]